MYNSLYRIEKHGTSEYIETHYFVSITGDTLKFLSESSLSLDIRRAAADTALAYAEALCEYHYQRALNKTKRDESYLESIDAKKSLEFALDAYCKKLVKELIGN